MKLILPGNYPPGAANGEKPFHLEFNSPNINLKRQDDLFSYL